MDGDPATAAADWDVHDGPGMLAAGALLHDGADAARGDGLHAAWTQPAWVQAAQQEEEAGHQLRQQQQQASSHAGQQGQPHKANGRRAHHHQHQHHQQQASLPDGEPDLPPGPHEAAADAGMADPLVPLSPAPEPYRSSSKHHAQELAAAAAAAAATARLKEADEQQQQQQDEDGGRAMQVDGDVEEQQHDPADGSSEQQGGHGNGLAHPAAAGQRAANGLRAGSPAGGHAADVAVPDIEPPYDAAAAAQLEAQVQQQEDADLLSFAAGEQQPQPGAPGEALFGTGPDEVGQRGGSGAAGVHGKGPQQRRRHQQRPKGPEQQQQQQLSTHEVDVGQFLAAADEDGMDVDVAGRPAAPQLPHHQQPFQQQPQQQQPSDELHLGVPEDDEDVEDDQAEQQPQRWQDAGEAVRQGAGAAPPLATACMAGGEQLSAAEAAASARAGPPQLSDFGLPFEPPPTLPDDPVRLLTGVDAAPGSSGAVLL